MVDAALRPEEVSRLYRQAAERTRAIVADLEELVRLESPSGDRQHLVTAAEHLTRAWQDVGARVVSHDAVDAGVHLEIRWDGPAGTPAGAPPALVLGHVDTVHPLGALDRNPLREADGVLHGPGTQDMKGGLVVAWHAVDLLRERGHRLQRPVVVLVTADEEVGSITSRPLVEHLARGSAHALVLEGAAADGSLKTARKGVGFYVLEMTGVSAHAGVHFEEGRNAAVDLARVLPRVAGLTDLSRGTTVNIGLVSAGTAVNVVPARAEARVDVRFSDVAEARRVDDALRTLAAHHAHLTVSGGVNRPAMVRDGRITALFTTARHLVAHEQSLTETAVGGASDGNFTAAVGTPTLDGLGPEGAGLHTDREHVRIASLAERTGLLASLLAGL